jgi:hypothetical protein
MPFRHRLLYIIAVLALASILNAQNFSIARIHYEGGGDWYSDPSSLHNLLAYITDNTPLKTDENIDHVKISDERFIYHPYLYLTGHGGFQLSDEEVIILRNHLLNGAFLHVDDNYGLDYDFFREMERVFPEKEFEELPYYHAIFNNYFQFPDGLPKIQEHDGFSPRAFALVDQERIMVLYTDECDLGDGWESAAVHNISQQKREQALKMGTNIVYYVLTQ